MVGGQVAFTRAQHDLEETSENRGQEVTRADLLPPARPYAKGFCLLFITYNTFGEETPSSRGQS